MLNELDLFNPAEQAPTFTKVYIVTLTAEQPLYVFFGQKCPMVTFLSPDEIPELDSFEQQTAINFLIIFDDVLQCGKEVQAEITDYFIRSRHCGFSCVYITQSYFGIDPKIRQNSSILALVGHMDKRNLRMIIDDGCAGVEESLVHQMLHETFLVPFVPFTIFKDKAPAERFRKGLIELFPVPPPPLPPAPHPVPFARAAPTALAPMALAPTALAPTALAPVHLRPTTIREKPIPQTVYSTPLCALKAIAKTILLLPHSTIIWDVTANKLIAGQLRSVDFVNVQSKTIDVVLTDFPSNGFMIGDLCTYSEDEVHRLMSEALRKTTFLFLLPTAFLSLPRFLRMFRTKPIGVGLILPAVLGAEVAWFSYGVPFEGYPADSAVSFLHLLEVPANKGKVLTIKLINDKEYELDENDRLWVVGLDDNVGYLENNEVYIDDKLLY